MRKSRLHALVEHDGNYWRSLPPHNPGACYGARGEPCPQTPDEPCKHNHRSANAAFTCSRNRPPIS